MTTPDVDQELERLFSVSRVATAPDAGARARVRTGLSSRLASAGPATPSAWGRRAWLGVGMAALGVGALALWLAAAPRAASIGAPIAQAASASAAPTLVSPPSVPEPEPALLSAPFASSQAPLPTPSLPPGKPSSSSSQGPGPEEELPLVRAMQQALRAGSPDQALRLAAEHTRRFPLGTLVEEREGVRAVARCQLAASDARPQILGSFMQHFAASPYASRVKAACQ
jgi:hypothetical protein